MKENKTAPLYSICMCNYNMSATLKPALTSILEQIDDRFEVVLIDDGSKDNSVEIAQNLALQFTNLHVIPLERDKDRRLGFTRNISIKHAKGKYVLLHLDCDDITAPYIIDFVNVFHDIEKGMDRDFLLSGAPIQMAKHDFLLGLGPYRNVNRGEDRDLISRLTTIKAYIPIAHQSFKTIIPKSFFSRFTRLIHHTFDHLCNDFRTGSSLLDFLSKEIKYKNRSSWQIKLVWLTLSIPTWIFAKIQGSLPKEDIVTDPEEIIAYRKKYGGTYETIAKRLGLTTNITFSSGEAHTMFYDVDNLTSF